MGKFIYRLKVSTIIRTLLVIIFYYCGIIFTSAKVTNNSYQTPLYSIVIPDNPSTKENYAAQELRKVFQEATTFTITINKESKSFNNTPNRTKIYIGNTKSSQKLSIKQLKTDGFFLIKNNDGIYLKGNDESLNDSQGTLNAVYRFLRDYVGVTLLAPNTFHYSKTSIRLPSSIYIVDNPVFLTRDLFNNFAYYNEYNKWYSLTTYFDNPNPRWGTFSHTTFGQIPPEVYFKNHPEYYSLIGGIRKPVQLCFSNKEVQRLLLEDFKNRATRFPNAQYWMLGQEDTNQFCECEDCKRELKKYGNNNGLLLQVANKIAENITNKNFAVLLFEKTLQPPKNILPRSNVIIALAAYGQHQNRSDLIKENNFVPALRQWNKLTKNLLVWDYYSNFSDVLAPYPNLRSFDNLKIYQGLNVKHMFIQMVREKEGEMKELKAYVMSNLLWNPQYNTDSLISDFCVKYYGETASTYVLKYLNALEKNSVTENATLGMNEDASKYFNSFLKPEYLYQYNAIITEAINKAKSSIVKQRLNDIAVSIDYAILKYGVNANGKLKNFTTSQLKSIKNRFNENTRRLGYKSLMHQNLKSINTFQKEIKF